MGSHNAKVCVCGGSKEDRERLWVQDVNFTLPPVLESDPDIIRRDTTTPSSTIVLEMTIQLEDRPGIPGAQVCDGHPCGTQRDPRVLASVGSQSNKHSMGVGRGRLQSSR